MTKRPRPEAISYIPLAARKEVVVNDELKMLSVNAPFTALITMLSKFQKTDKYYKIKLQYYTKF